MQKKRSEELFAQASKLIPGGVNSPVRAFKSVNSTPLFIKEARGSRLFDVDGNQYIDYVCSWGPMILGHSQGEVAAKVKEAVDRGTSYGAPCEAEVELAALIIEALPSIEKIRMVSSGTEATMSAVRLARACTGREKFVKFEGCYHGHGDSFLIKAGSGLMTAGVPSSPGITSGVSEDTLICTYNDLDSVKQVFKEHGASIAALIVEPVAANMGLVLPEKDFLEGIREICDLYGALLIFDEVISGFRCCYGGFQNMCGIEPDLTTLGKIIGGGFPVGAYGGRAELMNRIAPEGDVYQAGTLSGNPIAMTAGAATLNILRNSDWYDRIEVMAYYLTGQLRSVLEDAGCFFSINRLGSMFSIFCSESDIRGYADVMTCDTEFYACLFNALLEEGVYFPPSQFETCFVSAAHDLTDMEKTIIAFQKALKKCK